VQPHIYRLQYVVMNVLFIICIISSIYLDQVRTRETRFDILTLTAKYTVLDNYGCRV
jgi:hypothetical protein